MKTSLFILLLLFYFGLKLPTKVFATSANLRCVPSTGTYNIGDTFTVDYELDTRSFEAFGADLVATYDPSIIEAVDVQSTPETFATGWDQPTTNTIDTSLGKIELIYGQNQPAFSGTATIGKLTFRAIAAGQAPFNFTFFQQYDDTTPGVAKVWGKKDGVNLSNILTDVNNCIFVVEGFAPAETTPTPASSQNGAIVETPTPTIEETPTETPTPTLAIGGPEGLTPTPTYITGAPRAGSTQSTMLLFVIGGLVFSLGVIIKPFLS